MAVSREFVQGALEKGVRCDGRHLNAARHCEIEFGPQQGSAMVRMGGSIACASVNVEAVAPYADRPREGMFAASVDVSPGSCLWAATDVVAARELGIDMSRKLERLLRSARVLNNEDLVVVAGKLVWQVRVEVMILEVDGNVLDVAALVSVAALKYAKRPDVSIRGESIVLHALEEREAVYLPVNHTPYIVTFALFARTALPVAAHSSKRASLLVLVDPTEDEERLCDAQLSVSMNAFGEICGLSKAGGLAIDKENVMLCTSLAADRVRHLDGLFKHAWELANNGAPSKPQFNVRPSQVCIFPSKVPNIMSVPSASKRPRSERQVAPQAPKHADVIQGMDAEAQPPGIQPSAEAKNLSEKFGMADVQAELPKAAPATSVLQSTKTRKASGSEASNMIDKDSTGSSSSGDDLTKAIIKTKGKKKVKR
ncbi:Exosome complex component rrp45 [Porphyridium purpureum]|uniref:Exosome complex component rrp45 n=1 Tax=Porphyridium purpureum TaxID=35688 RepID=A0A5J4YWK9_PORPP|nr:Exosome complex component rrp45 [Porphyridium purpureum]|eukprot:POR1886..scf209_3